MPEGDVADNNLATVAFPAISTGVYGYPKNQAARLAVSAIRRYYTAESSLKTVYLVAFDAATAVMYREALDE